MASRYNEEAKPAESKEKSTVYAAQPPKAVFQFPPRRAKSVLENRRPASSSTGRWQDRRASSLKIKTGALALLFLVVISPVLALIVLVLVVGLSLEVLLALLILVILVLVLALVLILLSILVVLV